MNNKKMLIIFVALALLTLAFVSWKSLTSTQSKYDSSGKSVADTVNLPLDLTGETEIMMEMKNSAYTKPDIKIKKGTRVTWTNQDSMKHNAMEKHDEDDHPHPAPSEKEVKPDVFAGPLLNKGESYSFVFNKLGEYPYHCAPHPWMTGKVTVTE